MFGALNRFISRLDSDPINQTQSQGPGDSSYGFQVLRNTNKELQLEPWFDFIIGINGHYLENPDPNLFSTELQNCAGGYCSIEIWSAKGQRRHQISVSVPSPPQTLGLCLQLAPLNSTQNIWHILTIPSPLSPAHLAGLLPHSDYILGSPSGTLRGEGAFGELVEDHLNRSLTLWVYNSEFDVVREVELVPRRGWGGDGALGAVLGYGALHRLPVGLGEEVQAPGENLFDADRKSIERAYHGNPFQQAPQQDFVQPSTMMNQSLPPPPPMMNPNSTPASANPVPSRGKKGRHHGAISPNSGFDDMFAEGQKKSAEEDFVPPKKESGLPPPPKAGSAAVSPNVADNNKSNPMNNGQQEDLGEPGDAEET